ncbi:MAG: STAS domain-containing protein [Pseudomonadota bacterium]|nr:STAS domain-containing protein [Pseudomonadota bacterium]
MTIQVAADALSFEKAPQWYARLDEWTADGQIDLADVQQVDSAGAALLLELARRIRRKGGRLTISNPPQQLQDLLKFFGISQLLGTGATT